MSTSSSSVKGQKSFLFPSYGQVAVIFFQKLSVLWPSHHSTGSRLPERVAACRDSNQQSILAGVLQTVLLELCSCLGDLAAKTCTVLPKNGFVRLAYLAKMCCIKVHGSVAEQRKSCFLPLTKVANKFT